MNRRTLAALGAMILIALAAIGIGYGLWYEDLLVGGSVTTGTLDVGFSPPVRYRWFTDAEGIPIATQRGGVHPPEFPERAIDELMPDLFEIKDAIVCDAVLGEAADDSPVDLGYDLLTITVASAYPGYHCLVVYDVENLGTIPVHLALARLDPPQEPDADWVAAPVCRKRPADIHTDSSAELALISQGVIQLHHGEHADCAIEIAFTNADPVS